MPEKFYSFWLNEKTYVAVEFITVDGDVVSFVVRLMLCSEDSDKCVARYDTAHGSPHLDIVDRDGRLIEKKWLLGIGFAEAMRYAINDFKINYASYVQNFR